MLSTFAFLQRTTTLNNILRTLQRLTSGSDLENNYQISSLLLNKLPLALPSVFALRQMHLDKFESVFRVT